MQGYEVLKHMQGVPEHGNPPPVIRLYVDLNLQTLVSADIVPLTNGSADIASHPQPSAPRAAHVSSFVPFYLCHITAAVLTRCANSEPSDDRLLDKDLLAVQDQEATIKTGQMPHPSPKALQQSGVAEAAQAPSRATAESCAASKPLSAASLPTLDRQPSKAAADIQPQPVQHGLSGQEAPAPQGTAEAADTRQEETQRGEIKAYSKARKAPLIAVDANTQETANDAATAALQPNAHKQPTTPRASSVVLLQGLPNYSDLRFPLLNSRL